jgi:adenine phosphoribosyltransferase
MYHTMTIAGLERRLPLGRLNDERMIAGFTPFGDVELTCACARELLKKAPDFDYMIAPEAKAIPIIHEMARQSGRNTYLLVRKAPKLYMDGVFETEVRSITTAGVQRLYMDAADAAKIKGSRMLIIDDVISTGESLRAVETLVAKAGGTVAGRMAVLAEGDAIGRTDIIYLEPLPLFDQYGKPIR